MDETYELGNGLYACLDLQHGAVIYNEDNIITLNARQTEALKEALTQASGGTVE